MYDVISVNIPHNAQIKGTHNAADFLAHEKSVLANPGTKVFIINGVHRATVLLDLAKHTLQDSLRSLFSKVKCQIYVGLSDDQMYRVSKKMNAVRTASARESKHDWVNALRDEWKQEWSPQPTSMQDAKFTKVKETMLAKTTTWGVGVMSTHSAPLRIATWEEKLWEPFSQIMVLHSTYKLKGQKSPEEKGSAKGKQHIDDQGVTSQYLQRDNAYENTAIEFKSLLGFLAMDLDVQNKNAI